jgi:signal transduction histidine kinase
MLSDFQDSVKGLLERLGDSDSVPLQALETGARELRTLAAEHQAVGLERLSAGVASLARTAQATGAPISISVLDDALKALARADETENLAVLEATLERLEEDAFLYIPPIGALLLEPPSLNESAPKDERTPQTTRRVLSVDDSGLVRSALRRIFTEAGMEIEEAKNGEEALERFQEIGRYDLVMLDVNLPDTTGLELLPKLRERSTEVTVVMLTSEEDIKTAIGAIRAGADGYIQKSDLPLEGDRDPFFHAIEQAREARSGIVARQQIDMLKADFYSMVTHDLKNPANVIGLALEQLSDTANFLPEQRRAVQIASSAAKDLLHLVVEYLDYARIDAGYLELERRSANIADLVRRSVERAEVLAGARAQTMHTDIHEAGTFAVDAPRLTQVLDNLIGNAVKYTPEGGRIEVKLSTTDAGICFSVRDTGNGVRPDQLAQLFKRFSRLPGESRRASGTGLGLVIVKAIIEAHGGRVWAESAGIGEGSTFSFELPR